MPRYAANDCMHDEFNYVHIHISIGRLDDLCNFTFVRITQILEGMVNTQGACNNNGHDVSLHYYTLLQALLSKPKFLDRINPESVTLMYSWLIASGFQGVELPKSVCVCVGGATTKLNLLRHQDFFSS